MNKRRARRQLELGRRRYGDNENRNEGDAKEVVYYAPENQDEEATETPKIRTK